MYPEHIHETLSMQVRIFLFQNDKFLSSIEKDPPIRIDDIDDTSIICPVCLDFYFNAYTCKPCDHTFCEPCLRRLAKYCGASGKTTTCPVCREPIHHCQKDFGESGCRVFIKG